MPLKGIRQKPATIGAARFGLNQCTLEARRTGGPEIDLLAKAILSKDGKVLRKKDIDGLLGDCPPDITQSFVDSVSEVVLRSRHAC
jgi:hypothetical protein